MEEFAAIRRLDHLTPSEAADPELSFDQLFAPAIHIAEEGMPISEKLAACWTMRVDDLARLAETKQTFLKEDGSGFVAGDVFRQPALARTLRAVARAGMSAGADGLIIEVHPRPEETHSDGQQAISLNELGRIRRDAEAIANMDEATFVIPADQTSTPEPAL